MNDRAHNEWHHLFSAALNGTVTYAEKSQLATLLKTSAEARQLWFLYHDNECGLAELKQPPAVTAPFRSPANRAAWLSWRPLAAAAACALLALGWWAARPARVVEVMSVSGTVAWRGERGGQRPALVAGERLPAGGIESTDDEALIRLRFADDTRLEFSGPMRARVGDEAGKRVFVGKGVLTATVAPQPPGQPLRVSSPTAELEVLGTVFTLDAGEDDARLSVAEGRVRLRRIADGGVAEVAARQSIVASRSAGEPLVPVHRPAPPPEWSATFDPARECVLLGRPLPAEAQDPPRVLAVERKVEPGAPVTRAAFPQIHLAPARATQAPFATLVGGAKFEVRWRSRPRATTAVAIYTRRPHGGLGGNFVVHLDPDSPADADGWQHASVPLSAFRPTRPVGEPVMTGLEATRISVASHHKGARLEVAGLRLVAP